MIKNLNKTHQRKQNKLHRPNIQLTKSRFSTDHIKIPKFQGNQFETSPNKACMFAKNHKATPFSNMNHTIQVPKKSIKHNHNPKQTSNQTKNYRNQRRKMRNLPSQQLERPKIIKIRGCDQEDGRDQRCGTDCEKPSQQLERAKMAGFSSTP